MYKKDQSSKIKTYFEQAACQKRIRNYKESIEFLKKIIKLDPQIFESYFNISNLYQEKGNYGEAIKFYLWQKN
jgi:tetratricopeptide (TPR) repeat protein